MRGCDRTTCVNYNEHLSDNTNCCRTMVRDEQDIDECEKRKGAISKMKTTKEMIEVMQAYESGKTIRFIRHGASAWKILDKTDFVCWNWAENYYEIAPEPKYRPWKADEVPVGKAVKWCGNGLCDVRLIIGKMATPFLKIFLGGVARDISAEELLKEHKMEDGSPCGVKVE